MREVVFDFDGDDIATGARIALDVRTGFEGLGGAAKKAGMSMGSKSINKLDIPWDFS